MKELSIEEKAKRYDEAIEKAKTLYENANGMILKKWVEQVFPELKESEDERIRQFLIHEVTETSDEIMSYRNMNKKDVLTWLEKQGEHKSAWSEEDERILKTIIINIENLQFSEEVREKYHHIPSTNKNYYQIMADWLKSLKYRVQPNQEWSEEDEEMYKEVLTDIIYAKNDLKVKECLGLSKRAMKAFNWFSKRYKSLKSQNVWISVDKEVYVKEPILAQKKDKSDPFGGFVVCCDHTLTPNVYERYMILGNIVSQNTWKPSDEQIGVIEAVINNRSFQTRHLYSLYEQLKKLREE